MRRVTMCMSVVMALFVVAVYAGNAHFVGVPSVTAAEDTLIVSGKVAGLGNVPQIHVTLSADASCINRGNKNPEAANKDSFSAEGDFPVQNGKALFALSLDAVFQPPCNPPMTVAWSNISLVVTADDGTVLTFP